MKLLEQPNIPTCWTTQLKEDGCLHVKFFLSCLCEYLIHFYSKCCCGESPSSSTAFPQGLIQAQSDFNCITRLSIFFPVFQAGFMGPMSGFTALTEMLTRDILLAFYRQFVGLCVLPDALPLNVALLLC